MSSSAIGRLLAARPRQERELTRLPFEPRELRRDDRDPQQDDDEEHAVGGRDVLLGGAHAGSADPESAEAGSGSRQSLKRPLARPGAAMVVGRWVDAERLM